MANPEYIKEFSFGPEQVTAIDNTLQDLSDLIADPKTPEHTLFDEVVQYRQEARSMLPELSAELDDLASHGANMAVVIHLPEETSACYGPTPDAYPSDGNNLYPSDIYRALFTSLPDINEGEGFYAYNSSSIGFIQNNVVAVRNRQGIKAQSADPSRDFFLHTDGVFQNLNQGQGPDAGSGWDRNSSPDFLALHFIRNNERAHLQIVAPDAGELSENTKAVLREPILNLSTTTAPPQVVSILYGPEDRPWIRYNHEIFTGDIDRVPGPEAQVALKEFDMHLADRVQSIAVRAGSIVIFDNRRLLHGRPRYEALWDGNGRWQRRVALSTSRARIGQFLIKPHLADTLGVWGPGPYADSRGSDLNPNL